MKRFHEAAGVKASEHGFAVVLDGRPVLTPGRARLEVPTEELARAIAGEWDAQGGTIEPASMPLMRLAATALDHAGPERGAVLDGLAAFGASDLVCYRAERPADLVERQGACWQPLVDWAAHHHDALLVVTPGVVPVDQPADAMDALRRALERLDRFELAAVHAAARHTESLVIALAVLAGRVTGHEAFEAGALDDLYGLETWGEDDEARRALEAGRAELLAVERYLALLGHEDRPLAGSGASG